ncbi:MAG: PD-(D/E)XK nuclease family protein [Moorea sp. SIO4G3]|nr:PD-(D/E)XK nuclease family protein [Moorena sp. SIO4G3]
MAVAPADDDSQHLHQAVEALLAAAPDLFQTHEVDFRHSEHRQTLEFQGCLLTVVYDLLLFRSDHAYILDWKTYPLPPDTTSLTHNWQTRLYPFVLAETSPYLPEQISMIYWFVRSKPGHPPQPQSWQFDYTAAHHELIRQDLTRVLASLTHHLEGDRPNPSFPQVDEALGYCPQCQFALRCHRSPSGQASQPPNGLKVDEIEEVIL